MHLHSNTKNIYLQSCIKLQVDSVELLLNIKFIKMKTKKNSYLYKKKIQSIFNLIINSSKTRVGTQKVSRIYFDTFCVYETFFFM